MTVIGEPASSLLCPPFILNPLFGIPCRLRFLPSPLSILDWWAGGYG